MTSPTGGVVLFGNLTNLSQLGDTNVAGVADTNVLEWDAATGMWVPGTAISLATIIGFDYYNATNPPAEAFWSANYTLYNTTWSNTTNLSYVPYTGATGPLDLAGWDLDAHDITAANDLDVVNDLDVTDDVDVGGRLWVVENINTTMFNGYFNWTEDSPYLSFDTQTLSFSDAAMNGTIGIYNTSMLAYVGATFAPITEPLWSANYSLYNTTWSAGISWANAVNGTLMNNTWWNTNYTANNDDWLNRTNLSYVPYTGATGDIDISTWDIYGDDVFFDIINFTHLRSNIIGALDAAGDPWTISGTSLSVVGDFNATNIRGVFNWTEDSPYLSFTGTILSFSDAVMNTTIGIYNSSMAAYVDAKLQTLFYNATSLQVVTGTGQGVVDNLTEYHGATYNISEVNSDFDLRINFTGVDNVNQVLYRYKSEADESHDFQFQVWDYDDNDWENYAIEGPHHDWGVFVYPIIDQDNHLSGGLVQLRFFTTNGPPNQAHKWQFDWVTVSEGPATPSSSESDPFAIYHDGTTPLTGNWDTGPFNITSQYFIGNGSFLMDVNITETDPFWSGNQSNYATLATIDGWSFYNSTNLQPDVFWSGNQSSYLPLINNSMVNALHRHSELSASDGTPDQALTVDAIGRVNIVYDLIVDSNLLFVDVSPGYVGIGTDTPGEMLDVVGNAEITGNLTFANANNCIIFNSGGEICSA